MGPMTPTAFDMAQVFGLRPLGRCVDITHDWSSSSQPTARSPEASQDIVSLEYDPTTFKSYGTSFVDFIPFAKKNFCPPTPFAN